MKNKKTAIKVAAAFVLFVAAAVLLFRSDSTGGEPEALAPEVRQAVEQANRESGGEEARPATGAEESAPAFMPSARPGGR